MNYIVFVGNAYEKKEVVTDMYDIMLSLLWLSMILITAYAKEDK